mmetsp:Transcript_36404/g.50038  ORF Transcript_36404/g.50038 Transcript_36404/m.50038 type:complete len:216 (-) Transcript_36404:87-734(-)
MATRNHDSIHRVIKTDSAKRGFGSSISSRRSSRRSSSRKWCGSQFFLGFFFLFSFFRPFFRSSSFSPPFSPLRPFLSSLIFSFPLSSIVEEEEEEERTIFVAILPRIKPLSAIIDDLRLDASPIFHPTPPPKEAPSVLVQVVVVTRRGFLSCLESLDRKALIRISSSVFVLWTAFQAPCRLFFGCSPSCFSSSFSSLPLDPTVLISSGPTQNTSF